MPDPDIKKTLSQGLDEAGITAARFAHGRNVLSAPPGPTALKRYVSKFSDPMVRTLLFAACLSLLAGIIEHQYAAPLGTLLAIFITIAISSLLESGAERRFKRLGSLGNERRVKTVRGGAVCEIPRSEIVVGDTVLLCQGDEIPADGTLLDSHSMIVDESALDGEAHTPKSASHAADSQLFRSSIVAQGDGVMQVSAVGDATKLARLSSGKGILPTANNLLLDRQLKRISSKITVAVYIVALASFLYLTSKDLRHISLSNSLCWLHVIKALVSNFMLSVALIVITGTKTLPIALSLALAFNLRRMHRSGILIKQPQAADTLGAITVVCTDISATLTQNNMQVADYIFCGPRKDFFLAIAANSTAHLDRRNRHRGIGSPLECALLQWMEKEGENYLELRQSVKIISRKPFSPEDKLMATLVETPQGERQLFVKGAPEAVRRLCNPNSANAADFDSLIPQHSRSAMHTIAFARKTVSPSDADAASCTSAGNLTYTGYAATSDPMRPDIPDAVAQCRKAGVRIKIITGEDSGMALALAQQAGILTDRDGKESIMTGEEFARISDEEALHRIQNLKIISNARPKDKLRLVQLLRTLGEVVAVTGNDASDTPALRHASIGMAKGSGSDAAKEAANVILTEDSFATIPTAVKWGRALYENLQRHVLFRLTINITLMLVMLLGAFLSRELTFTVTQLLWLSLIMDTFAALALVSLPPSNRVMGRKPRRLADFLLTKGMRRIMYATVFVFTATLIIMLLIVNWGISIHPGESIYRLKNLSMFFTTFVMLQFWYLLSVRAFGSRNFAFHKFFKCHGMLLVLLAILAGQALIIECGGPVFRTFHLNFSVWVEIFLTTSLVYSVPEIIRALRRRVSLAQSKRLQTKQHINK